MVAKAQADTRSKTRASTVKSETLHDDDGKLLTKTKYNVDGSREILFYDADNPYMKAINNMNADGNIDYSITHYTYYDTTTGKITGSGKNVENNVGSEETEYYDNGNVKTKELRDTTNNLTSKETYDITGTLRYQLKLNPDKTKQEEKRYDATGKLVYDLNDKVTSKKSVESPQIDSPQISINEFSKPHLLPADQPIKTFDEQVFMKLILESMVISEMLEQEARRTALIKTMTAAE